MDAPDKVRAVSKPRPLQVIHVFGGHSRGGAITDTAQFVERVRACGWFAEMSTREQAALRQRLTAAVAYAKKWKVKPTEETFLSALGYSDLLEADVALEHPWVSWLDALGQWSGGVFTPTNVRREGSKGDARVVTFQFGGKSFKGSLRFDFDEGGMPEGLLTLANSALRGAQITRRFIPLPAGVTVFISPKLYSAAQAEGLIPKRLVNPVTGGSMAWNPLSDPDYK